jgi:hypothetical protein
MRNTRWLVFPILAFFLLACSLSNGIQQLQQAVTKLPAALTSMPTTMGVVSTVAAGQIQPAGTAIPGTLGVSLETAKAVLSATQQFAFADGTTGGQPETVATLINGAASTFPTIAAGFKAELIGNPASLSKIKVTIPRDDQKATAEEGVGVLNILFTGMLPPDVQLGFLAWSAQNYANVQVGGQQQVTFGSFQFTMARSQTDMTVDVDPVK